MTGACRDVAAVFGAADLAHMEGRCGGVSMLGGGDRDELRSFAVA
jgi:hypothetical protein